MPLAKDVLQHRRSVLFQIWANEHREKLRAHLAQEKLREERRKTEIDVLIASDEFSFLSAASASLRPGSH
jgi:hypothetical protein